MHKLSQEISVWSALAASALARFLGGPHEHLEVLATLMVLDWLAAVLRAFVRGRPLSPDISRRGLARKLMYFVAVAFGHALDRFLESGDLVRLTVLKLLIATEAVSILNSLGMVDIKLPQWIYGKIERVSESLREGPGAPPDGQA